MLRGIAVGLWLWPVLSLATDLPPPTLERFHQDVAWSPDGQQIAFISGGWPKTAIYVLRLADSQIVKIIN